MCDRTQLNRLPGLLQQLMIEGNYHKPVVCVCVCKKGILQNRSSAICYVPGGLYAFSLPRGLHKQREHSNIISAKKDLKLGIYFRYEERLRAKSCAC